MKKTKVLFITPSLCQGGIEHSLITMLKLIDKDKFDITLFLYSEDNALLSLVPEHVKIIIDQDNNHYYRRPKAILLNLLKSFEKEKYAQKLRAYIRNQRAMHPAKDIFKKESFDVAVSYAVGICTEMIPYISAKKRYVFFHSSVDLHHEMLEREFSKYNGIIAVSPGVQEMLRKAYPRFGNKVFVLQNYVDAERVLQKAMDKQNVVSETQDVIQICSCGRLSPEKGFDMAVDTAALLKERGYVFKWYFIGGGVERGKVEALIERYHLKEHVLITGYVENPFPIIKSCDVYVQPSYEESYGMTIREAMILGVPVVSTATVGGNTLIQDEETGILTTIDANGLADGIEHMLQNKDLQEKCRQLYSEEKNEQDREEYKNKIEQVLLGE